MNMHSNHVCGHCWQRYTYLMHVHRTGLMSADRERWSGVTQGVIHIRKVEGLSEQRAGAAAPQAGCVRKQEVLKQHAGLDRQQKRLPPQPAAVPAVRLCLGDNSEPVLHPEINCMSVFVLCHRSRVLSMTVPGGRTVSCGADSERSAGMFLTLRLLALWVSANLYYTRL